MLTLRYCKINISSETKNYSSQTSKLTVGRPLFIKILERI